MASFLHQSPVRRRARVVSVALVVVALAAPALAAPALAAAEGTIFRWVDRRGNLHLTDELADVPEPYYGLYRARLRELEERKAATKAPAPPAREPTPAPPAAAPQQPSIIDREAARRASWKALVAHWRAELAVATDELAAADQRVGELRANALLAQTPAVRAEIEQASATREKALSRVEAARRMLLEELPARARRESVPPAWLM